jgi:hypothetical protein
MLFGGEGGSHENTRRRSRLEVAPRSEADSRALGARRAHGRFARERVPIANGRHRKWPGVPDLLRGLVRHEQDMLGGGNRSAADRFPPPRVAVRPYPVSVPGAHESRSSKRLPAPHASYWTGPLRFDLKAHHAILRTRTSQRILLSIMSTRKPFGIHEQMFLAAETKASIRCRSLRTVMSSSPKRRSSGCCGARHTRPGGSRAPPPVARGRPSRRKPGPASARGRSRRDRGWIEERAWTR